MPTIIAVLNWKNYKVTKKCLESLIESKLPKESQIHLLDNESHRVQLTELKNQIETQYNLPLHTTPYLLNTGFAQAYNQFFEQIIPTLSEGDNIIILNNDTEVIHHFVQKMTGKIDRNSKTEMITATILELKDRKTIDNTGVTMYKSGIAFSRSKPEHKLFCASGAATLYTVNLLNTLKEKTGHYFDPDFFCYTEDVDLGYRALLLGFKPAHAKEAIVYHHRTLSSGGPFNEFVLYHGMRNTLYSTTKNTPWPLLLQYLPYIITAHLAVSVRSITQGKLRITYSIWKDYLKALPTLLKKRKKIQQAKTLSTKDLKSYITPQFFDPEYLKFCLKTLFKRNLVRPSHRPLSKKQHDERKKKEPAPA